MNYINKFKSFFGRYWDLMAFGALTLALFLSNTIFSFLGTMIFVPALTSLGILLVLAIRSIFNSDTTDKYVDEGHYTKDFDLLSPKEKVYLTTVQFFVYLIFVALIILAAV